MRSRRAAFTMLELLISLAVVSVLLAILLPALSSARVAKHCALCAGNQRLVGEAWDHYRADHGGRFPVIYVQPAWLYGGVRFSSATGEPFLDQGRPLSRYLPAARLHEGQAETIFACPADRGITDERGDVGTGRRTAYRAFGTSFRANAELLRPRTGDQGLHRDEITSAPSRLLVMGDPVWYEVHENTGMRASWHGDPGAGNLLFLDGSVRFVTMTPGTHVGPVVLDPLAAEFEFPGARGAAGP